MSVTECAQVFLRSLLPIFIQMCYVCADIFPTVLCQLTSATTLTVQMTTMLQPSEFVKSSLPVDLTLKFLQSPLVTVLLKSHYVFSCLDARFYDDEMLTVVLRRVEEDNCRVLAQLPLASTLSFETEFNWEPNLRFVFVCLNTQFVLQ